MEQTISKKIISTEAAVSDAEAKRGIKRCGESLNADNAAEQALIQILAQAQINKCSFCEGLGHHVKQCSSLKNINDAVKNLP